MNTPIPSLIQMQSQLLRAITDASLRSEIARRWGLELPNPASKPSDAALVRALRPRRMRIGLRYLGD